MHFHVPKSLHGWREFLREYAIVVLGVLTALGLEQAVSSAHERRLAREAHEAIDGELQVDLDRVAYRARFQACDEKRLDDIEALLSNWHGDNAFPAGLHVGFPGNVGLVDQRWQANLSSGRFSEQSAEEQAEQASIYTTIHVIGAAEATETTDWAQLRTLELGSEALTPASKPMIAEALAGARGEAEVLGRLTAFFLRRTRQAGPGRPGMRPRTDFTAAVPGTACEPMRKKNPS
jgi:hypothetical protein